jgi:glycine betaine/choline ABC-type transport system substrate-binding protein
VRSETLARYPDLRAALGELGERLTDAGMRRLNYMVDVERRSVADVAGEFLASWDQ